MNLPTRSLPPAAAGAPDGCGQTVKPIARQLLFLLLLLTAAPLRAGRPATEGELVERYSAHRTEFRQLAALLTAQRGNVFGPRYGEWARLKEVVGIKTFQNPGGQNRLGLRFPVVLRTDLFQFTRGSTRGYAWLPNPPRAPGSRERPGEPRLRPPADGLRLHRPPPSAAGRPTARRPRPIRHRPAPHRGPLVSVCRQRPLPTPAGKAAGFARRKGAGRKAGKSGEKSASSPRLHRFPRRF